ncbi:MAG: tRNA (adenosine(37)-N6)-dimethylallyltransferase MiaA [Sphingobacteriia bacterium]|nr:tRNA (adenosine(37)-N6)-dimethylallyltransferase MiaA [Sphingobacteriia bacterium]
MTPKTGKSSGHLLVVVLGPTAVGKTETALKIAEHFNTIIISADSRQFYRELKIGTAAPTTLQKSRVPHYLTGHLSVVDYYNVSRFEKDVLDLLDVHFPTRNPIILAGGSGLYLDAVCRGIDDLPDPDKEIRSEIEKLYSERGITYLQDELLKLDPEYFKIVDKSNPNRLKRAVEVCLLTGKTYTSLRLNQPKQRPFDIIKIGLNLPREELFERISIRTGQMIADGLVNEVKKLTGHRNLNAMNTVGYKEILEYLNEKISLGQAVTNIKTNTRRYAKRQLTWFKKDKNINWFSPFETDEIIQLIEKHMR